MVTVGTPALAAPVAGEVLPQAERLTIKSLFIAGAAFRSGGKQPKLFCPEVLQALACAAPNCLKRVKE